MLNLSVLLEDSARRYPTRDALVFGSTRLTYAQVDGAANKVANLLVQRGVRPGDKVALSCPNLPSFPVVYYGVLKAGATVVPLNILLKRREIADQLRDADVTAYFCFEGSTELPLGAEGFAAFNQVDAVEHFFLITADEAAVSPVAGAETLHAALADHSAAFAAVPTEATDTAVILYTSGTTGRAKGAELSHANAVTNVLTVNRLFDCTPATDTHLVCLPLFHTFGATVQMNAGFAAAATLHLVPRFDAEQVVGLMNSEAITFFAGVPTMWWGLLNALTDDIDVERIADNLRVGLCGAAPLPREIQNQVKERLRVTILEGYGLSETAVATFNDPVRAPRIGSIGLPIWGVEVKLINDDWTELADAGGVGEIAIKGHNVMKGYYGRPDATAEVIRDGWFRTGDLGRTDEDGYIYVVDRSKDLVIRGGFNVYPREIEDVLMSHPAVSLAAVIGVPHDSHGEEIKAFVILESGAATTAGELIDWGKTQMAMYKYPRVVEIVESLPMTATGKILKRALT